MDCSNVCKIYEEYFLRKQEVINQLLGYCKEKGQKVALWGAGKKGVGFLRAYDLHNERIDYIYDKDEKKYGVSIETGHTVVDYRKELAEVVFVANSIFELEVLHLVKAVNPLAKVINLDNIILGDLEIKDIWQESRPDLKKVRDNKICAVVAIYNPDTEVVNNVKSYISQVDKVYLYDNSEKVKEDVVQQLKELNGVVYIYSGGNQGLSVAFNEVARIARGEGYEWMITFDQDSRAGDGMIAAMREYADSISCDDTIAIIAPMVNDIDDKKDTQDIYSTYCDKVIQSGAMNRLSVMNDVGGYDEKLFIDEVDNEYCIRCILKGYKIIRINNAVLMHNQQDEQVSRKFVDGVTLYINKYSTARYYYRYRNALYCYHLYKDSYSLYALDCLNVIRKIELQMPCESNHKEIFSVVEQAKKDFESDTMGKMKVERE